MCYSTEEKLLADRFRRSDMSDTIKKITIEGFKSIRELKEFELRSLNVLIGANGAGKSNFVSFFRLLRELIDQRLQVAVAKEGGAARCLYLGPRMTKQLIAKLHFGNNSYEFVLEPTADDRLIFTEEKVTHYIPRIEHDTALRSQHAETEIGPLHLQVKGGYWESKELAVSYLSKAVANWVVYHFHDTSDTAPVRRPGQINDNEFLRASAENLAAFLFRVRQTDPTNYEKIRDVVRLAAPFFDDFKLRPDPTNPDMIRLEWLQKESDYPFLASQLSDGTLRFICLATALLQPLLPPTVLFDEPELGLHPYALTLLANLFQQAATQYGSFVPKQVIVSTQSAPLLNEFDPEDVVVVERTQGQSTFRRLLTADLSEWLKEYTLGELWQKNVLGGRPHSEDAPQPLNSEPTRA